MSTNASLPSQAASEQLFELGSGGANYKWRVNATHVDMSAPGPAPLPLTFHAEPQTVTIDLRRTPGEVILCVADDGHGMQAKPAASKAAKPTLGVGIPGMRIRLHQFGGTLRIRSGRSGTLVRACVPRSRENLVDDAH